jgi:hypothetical protein
MPLALQISTHWSLSEAATIACASVGASAPNTITHMASQAAKRR